MVIWSEPAKKSLKSIYEYIALDSVYYAKEVVDNLLKKTSSLDVFPNQGRIVPELDLENIRELFLYSYRLIYQVENDTIRILNVIHGNRELTEKLIKK